MRRPTLAMLPVCAALLALAPSASGRADWPLQVTTLSLPAAAGSGQPQMSSSPGGAIVSWIERSGAKATLKFARRTTSGWSDARSVASGDDWFVNWADVPSVVALADGSLAAHWLQKSGPGTYAYDVKLAFSKDDGTTWSAAVSPHSDGTKTEHGFASLFEMPGGGLGLVWLDGRAMGAQHGEHGGGGAMSLRFGAFGRDARQTAETPVDLRVCECCPTTAAVTSEGVIVAYRDRSEKEIRDIYTSRLVNGKWTSPAPVHKDNWRIAACPVNGPALAARGRTVALAWFTMKDGQGQAYLAFSSDAGRTFGAPVRLDDEVSLGRVDVELLADGAAVALWVEAVENGAALRARRVEPAGTKTPSMTVATLNASRASGYPRLAQNGDELLFAWTERDGSSQRVRTAAASIR